MKFKEQTTKFLGRNGTFNCTGLAITGNDYTKTLTIEPITSKDVTGRCYIEIPYADVDNMLIKINAARLFPR